MSTRAFFTQDAKARVSATIKEIEAQTSAEVVVAVRHESGVYRAADYLFGALAALSTLAFMLFSRRVFPIRWFPADVTVAFVVGVFVCANFPLLRRLLTPGKQMKENVHAAACAAFIKMGVSRTTGRNGILVFVSLFEKKIEVLPDIGVDMSALDKDWPRFLAGLEQSMGFQADFDRFVEGLRALGPIAKGPMPRSEDDVNELPDEVDAV